MCNSFNQFDPRTEKALRVLLVLIALFNGEHPPKFVCELRIKEGGIVFDEWCIEHCSFMHEHAMCYNRTLALIRLASV